MSNQTKRPNHEALRAAQAYLRGKAEGSLRGARYFARPRWRAKLEDAIKAIMRLEGVRPTPTLVEEAIVAAKAARDTVQGATWLFISEKRSEVVFRLNEAISFLERHKAVTAFEVFGRVSGYSIDEVNRTTVSDLQAKARQLHTEVKRLRMVADALDTDAYKLTCDAEAIDEFLTLLQPSP